MNTKSSPGLLLIKDVSQRNAAIELLKQNNLPVSDLDENKDLYALVEDQNIIATGGLEFFGDCALLRSVSVKKEEQGRGWGKIINGELEIVAKNKGVNCLYLLTTTAKDFFYKEGYIVVNRDEVPEPIKNSSEFSSVCPSTAIVMKKEIAAYE